MQAQKVSSVEVIEVPSDFGLFSSEGVEVVVDQSVSLLSSAVSNALYVSRRPIVLRGIDIGSCIQKWTPDYLKAVNEDKKVKIHRSATPQLDFRAKNFTYETISFADLIEHCSSNSKTNGPDPKEIERDYLYLRSLGFDRRGKDIADISLQFPELYSDLKIPRLFPPTSFFSSVFRITSPHLQLWTHYDTCDNILIQIRGTKRIVFFPPSQALNLYLDGDKSTVVNIDKPDLNIFPNFGKVEKLEVILQEGDIVFIPALWFHNVIALDFSISVNVFWKNLDSDLYDKKDTYGNRDLIPAQLGFRTLEKAVSQLKSLPKSYQDFYLRRMIIYLEKNLATVEDNRL